MSLVFCLECNIWAQPDHLPNLISNITQFNLLEPSVAERNIPVQLTATVTYYDPIWKILILQDDKQGVYVESWGFSGLKVGDVVEMKGVSSLATGRPEIKPHRLTVIQSPGKMPTPKSVNKDNLSQFPNQWVKATGMVRVIETNHDHIILSLQMEGLAAQVFLPGSGSMDSSVLLDSVIQFDGVYGISHSGGVNAQAQFFVPDLGHVRVKVEGNGRIWDMTPRTVRNLLVHYQDIASTQRVLIKGVVQAFKASEYPVIADTTGNIRIQCVAAEDLQPGSPVMVSGFLMKDAVGPMLGDAMWQPIQATFGSQTRPTNALLGPAKDTNRVVSLAREAYQLRRNEAAKEYPVALNGVVTYADNEWGSTFFQDASGAVYLKHKETGYAIKSGDVVEVHGITQAGMLSPIVSNATFIVRGSTNLPSPHKVRLSELMTGEYDCHWVEIEGVVHSMELQQKHLYMVIMTGEGSLRVIVPAFTNSPPEKYINARVRIRGACGAEMGLDRRRIESIRLNVPNLTEDYIQVIETPPADLFSAPNEPIQDLYLFNARDARVQWVKVAGQITLKYSPNEFYLQDESGGVLVRTYQTNLFHMGDTLEVVGFLIHQGGKPMLWNALFRSASPIVRIVPLAIHKLDDILYSSISDAQLVTVQAFLLDNLPPLDHPRLLLENDGVTFLAACGDDEPHDHSAMLRYKRGSLLELTGICSIIAGGAGLPNSFRVLLRNPQEIHLLHAPPLWNTSRIWDVVSGLALLVALALVWILMLRRQVRAQTSLMKQRLDSEAELEDRFRELFENANDLLFTTTIQGVFTSVNRSMQQFFGADSSAFCQMNLEGITIPDQRELVRRNIQELSSGETNKQFELHVQKNDQSSAILVVNLHMLRHNGSPVMIQGIAHDITERQVFAESLSRERNLLRTLIDNIPDRVYVKDLQGRYLLVNKAFDGFAPKTNSPSTLGKTVFDIFPPELAQVYHADDQLVIHSGIPMMDHEEPSVDTRANRCRYITSKVALKDDKGQIIGLVGISRDITDRHSLEAQLRQAQKMESIGQLAAGVAHDFNNILTVIQGHAGILMTLPNNTPDAKDALKQISDASQRAANLTRQLLTFSRKQVIQPKTIDLNDLITNLSKMLARLLGEEINVRYLYNSTPPIVYADAGMIEQVLMNLAVNARDAMPKGGQLTVRTDIVDIDSLYVQHNREAQVGRFVRLIVSDTGHGMDDATLNRIFEPFFTTKEAGKGTGLGLATVYGIVKQHQGWLRVESSPGKGAQFQMFFPLSAHSVASETALPLAPAVGGGETILVVEDEEALRLMVKRVLERNGYRIIIAQTGKEAMEIWPKHRQSVQLLLTDMVMPDGLSGKDLADRLMAEDPKLKILYTSGYSVDLAKDGSRFVPGVNFIAKPYEPDVLLRLVRSILDRKQT